MDIDLVAQVDGQLFTVVGAQPVVADDDDEEENDDDNEDDDNDDDLNFSWG